MAQHFKYYTNSLGRRYCTIRYLEANQILTVIWKGTASEESIKEVEHGVLEMAIRHECHAIINDVQEFFNASTEILADLTRSEWDRKVVTTSGVKYIAHVLSPEKELPKPVEGCDDSPEIRFFGHKMDALEWVNSKVKS